MSAARWRLLLGIVLGVLLAAGCGEHEPGAPAPGPEDQDHEADPDPGQDPDPGAVLVVQPVVWNRADAAVGEVASVVDGSETVVVLGSKGALVLEHGEVASTDPTKVAWRTSAVIPAGDGGGGRWTVGIDAEGGVYRIQPRVGVEGISARYGLERDVVLAAAASGGSAVFGLAEGVAVADGEKVTRYATAPFESLAGSEDGRVAMAGSGVVQAFDPAAGQVTTFTLPGAAHVAFDPEGRLLASTATSLYGEDQDGALALLYEVEEAGASIHGLVTSGDRVWLAVGPELGLLSAGVVVRSTGLGLPLDARLIEASTGDVWAIAGGELLRFSADTSQGDEGALWEQRIRPIMEAACSRCHQPGGPAGIDLSTYATWVSRRTAIQQRVIVERDMPPPGFDFSEADREAVAAWIQGGR
ncbi:hypothetical protein SOCE26_048300 [Sorangium cellulosum]|uniref:Cytochrome c domain-containing protein n=1 Tax=Sorangium cellulosum TaxID=56 RepID=A0A2L0EVT2_SORCE|nr:cytochrome c [Sorangium cellulosum]AUX43382.1 hypothetical protein SOCE26_048300 [Sorangium cellulosum]